MGGGEQDMASSRINKVAQREADFAKNSKYGVLLTPDVFKDLDADNSGSIDLQELKALFGSKATDEEVEMLMLRADLDGNGMIDYPEYERVMKMQRNGDAFGGNLWVRNAIKAGFLRGNSILADGSSSLVPGNKGFDPFNLATGADAADSTFRLKNYREAELKHEQLARVFCEPALRHLRASARAICTEWRTRSVPTTLDGDHRDLCDHRGQVCVRQRS